MTHRVVLVPATGNPQFRLYGGSTLDSACCGDILFRFQARDVLNSKLFDHLDRVEADVVWRSHNATISQLAGSCQ